MHEQPRNNLELLRLLAATAVLVSHAYPLQGGTDPWFFGLSSLGGLGVMVFFSISGYLCTESWGRDPHVGRFFARRALRIFPGLAVAVLLTAGVLGAALSTLPLREYLRHEWTQAYLLNTVLFTQYRLPGLFESNPLPVVNGSLWTLPVEVFAYVLLVAVALVARRRLGWAAIAMALVLGTFETSYWERWPQGLLLWGADLRYVAHFGVYFFIGSAAAVWREKLSFTLGGVTLGFVALIAAAGTPWIRPVAWLAVPYITLAFGLSARGLLGEVGRFGDLSYGVYVYAYPVQQAVVVLLGPKLHVGLFILLSLLPTLVLSLLSWHFVEKPALRLKPRTKRARAAQDGPPALVSPAAG